MKITIPYCTPAMLDALKKIHESGDWMSSSMDMLKTLRARGWINNNGSITSKGIAFISRH